MATDYHKTKQLNLRIEPEYKDKLATIAEIENKSMTQVVRELLDTR